MLFTEALLEFSNFYSNAVHDLCGQKNSPTPTPYLDFGDFFYPSKLKNFADILARSTH